MTEYQAIHFYSFKTIITMIPQKTYLGENDEKYG